ncbi:MULTISPECIES: GNAT family N-acetyltransferase [unclassified Luteimonas]|uniref:GNAT family N-acetyltransferase n=1 Tax=unclassified Luteimonas TaxID=2629088 RepID=UPI0018F0DADC|nr:MULTISPECIES: GNAT family N-acetyltransferase [unclassified Luteimonas]MBJ6981805.1 GNAT family N-acetyltransferase [Luteimonas sp. MC1572]MBJ7575634.1 GNAT family N-acetyltransferase [Luteimonas sp. MC1828]QQO03088.1 GNAT family N-acetyltransferase [Luteimonas sp. MC1572]
MSTNDHPGEPFLQTRRMALRGLRHGDVFDLQRLGRDARVTHALLDAPVDDIASACALVDTANRIYRERPGLGIWRADDARGFLGFFSLMAELAPGEVEIGTRLLPRAWGRGYALEGGAALCEHAFATLGLPALVGLCDPANRSVPPLLMRLGFMPAGEVEQRGRRALRLRLAREDWRGVRRRIEVA